MWKKWKRIECRIEFSGHVFVLSVYFGVMMLHIPGASNTDFVKKMFLLSFTASFRCLFGCRFFFRLLSSLNFWMGECALAYTTRLRMACIPCATLVFNLIITFFSNTHTRMKYVNLRVLFGNKIKWRKLQVKGTPSVAWAHKWERDKITCIECESKIFVGNKNGTKSQFSDRPDHRRTCHLISHMVSTLDVDETKYQTLLRESRICRFRRKKKKENIPYMHPHDNNE